MRILAICSLLVILAILWGAFELVRDTDSYKKCQCEYSQHDSENDAQTSQKNLAIIIKTSKRVLECGVKALGDSNAVVSALSAIVTAAATVLLVIVTIGLIIGGIRQENTTQRQLRAYVLIEKARIDNVAIGQKPIVTVTIRNSGQTPAKRFRQWYQIGSDAIPPFVPNPPKSSDNEMHVHTLAPNAEIFAVGTRQIPLLASEIAAMKEGKFAIYFVGEIFYTDIFGEERFTRYKLFSCNIEGSSGAMAAWKDGNKDT